MKMKKADVAVAIYIMAAIIMFIVPIPSWLLDILLAINISVALTILFATMFSKEVLDMSFFPTMLLFTTIFRIALNTSSTRLILRDGNAGNVVETFGEFVGGGDLVIGVIIFIILILIQFMVINKGSERVSEVTARFTLDAMPGKQMAIDADLNTGAITDAEAKKRREKIQEEASFFGSMDGAVKYVKGDAVAGLLITTINIVGGIIMGMTRQGMDITSALNKYAILTIGDGLVSQIPSLLISLSTGILVTKGSKDADFGTTLVSQLFGVPKGLYLVGAMLAIRGLEGDTAGATKCTAGMAGTDHPEPVTGPLEGGADPKPGRGYGDAAGGTGRVHPRPSGTGAGGGGDPAAGKCQQSVAGGSHRAGIRLRYHSAGGCEPGW